jgi:hypothetical protein
VTDPPAQDIDELIVQSSKRLTATIRETAPEALRAHRAQRTRFERRLAKTWKQALDLYEVIFLAAWEAGEALNDCYRPKGAAENDLVFETLVRLHARACLTASEIRALLASGHSLGADARWRTLHELAVVAGLIKRYGAEVAERYQLHAYVDTLRNAEAYQAVCSKLQQYAGSGYDPIPDDELSQLRGTVAELVARFGRAYKSDWGWAAHLFGDRPPTFSQLEQLAELEHLRPLYRLGNLGVHAMAKGIERSAMRRGPHQILVAGPSNAGLADAGAGAVISLYQVTTVLLMYGWEKLSDPMLLIKCSAIGELVGEATTLFPQIEQRLQADDDKLWREIEQAR